MVAAVTIDQAWAVGYNTEWKSMDPSTTIKEGPSVSTSLNYGKNSMEILV